MSRVINLSYHIGQETSGWEGDKNSKALKTKQTG